jgi:hypothetical protein
MPHGLFIADGSITLDGSACVLLLVEESQDGWTAHVVCSDGRGYALSVDEETKTKLENA